MAAAASADCDAGQQHVEQVDDETTLLPPYAAEGADAAVVLVAGVLLLLLLGAQQLQPAVGADVSADDVRGVVDVVEFASQGSARGGSGYT